MTAAELDKALSTKERKVKHPDRLRLGVTLRNDNAKVVRQALKQAGVDGNLSGYVRDLVLADLKRRLGKKGVKAEETAEVTP